MGKLFGTDGIRGVANSEPMTSDLALKIGQALAYEMKKEEGHRPRIVVGKDTRLSGYMIESAIAAGICSMGADVILVGPVPTPGIAFLTNNMDADAGVVISASHNPFQDNGIKIFSNAGYKLNTEQENAIEELVFSDNLSNLLPAATEIGRAYREQDALGRYIVFLRRTLHKSMSLEGMKIAVDCANGATYKVAPTLFKEMRAEVISTGVDPNGYNINKDAGSLFPENISRAVTNAGANIGLAFDGDGDRLIVSDEKGTIVSGDKIIAICANQLKQEGSLDNNLVVTTPMSNIGLLKTFEKLQIDRIEAPIGDRFVLEKMLEHGSILGGEDSGHVIFLEHHTTGDGILTALQLLLVMKTTGKPLSELAEVMTTFPQILENIIVKEKKTLEDIPSIQSVIKEVEDELGSNGRVLVRYSGTQPMLRIMVEGPTQEQTQKSVQRITEIAKKELA
ncbi:phosphoglucosamine mutase [Elusimicrobiota bacterium]